jgi:predicted secreted hydrolase
LGLDENLTPTQQVRKLELWPLFKEAKATSKRAFWRTAKLFIKSIQICPPSSI